MIHVFNALAYGIGALLIFLGIGVVAMKAIIRTEDWIARKQYEPTPEDHAIANGYYPFKSPEEKRAFVEKYSN